MKLARTSRIIKNEKIPNSLIDSIGFVEAGDQGTQVQKRPCGFICRIKAVIHDKKERRILKALVARPGGAANWITTSTLSKHWKRV